LKRLEKCVKRRHLSTSRTREIIYKILKDEKEKCFSIKDISTKAEEVYPKSISINSIYRHLNLFVQCDLISVIQTDSKKSYYCFKDEETPVFEICTSCLCIKKSNNLQITTTKEKIFQIIVYKKCFTCKT